MVGAALRLRVQRYVTRAKASNKMHTKRRCVHHFFIYVNFDSKPCAYSKVRRAASICLMSGRLGEWGE